MVCSGAVAAVAAAAACFHFAAGDTLLLAKNGRESACDKVLTLAMLSSVLGMPVGRRLAEPGDDIELNILLLRVAGALGEILACVLLVGVWVLPCLELSPVIKSLVCRAD